MRDILGLQHAFFNPPWRRVAIVVVCLGWSALEFSGGSPLFGYLMLGLGLYTGWFFRFVFQRVESKSSDDP